MNQSNDRTGTATSGKIRWKLALLAYFCLVWGMVAQALYAYVTGTSNWAWATLLAPLLVSPMIFGTFLALVKSEIDILTGAVMAFQNGFFWKQIFDGLSPILRATGKGQ